MSATPELDAALQRCATATPLLVALDFDGTLAPLVDNPMDSRMIPEARSALEALTESGGVTIALVTGRAIESILQVADPLPSWWLVGSHGIEVVSPEQRGGYFTARIVPAELEEGFRGIVDAHPGTRVEYKPFGVALHTRGVDPERAAFAEHAAQQLCRDWAGGIVVRLGHGIVECALRDATKGDGIREVTAAIGAECVVFAGDDRTDEDGFAVLGEKDVAIRVGGGQTIAPYRLADAHAVASALWRIHDLRA